MNTYSNEIFLTLANLDMTALALAGNEEERKKCAFRLRIHANNALKKSSRDNLSVSLMQEMAPFFRDYFNLRPYVEPVIWDMFKKSKSSSNPLVQKQAQNELLSCFFNISPSTLQGKKLLLNELLQKQDIMACNKAAPQILQQLILHYVKSNQHQQDPDFSVVSLAASVLNKLASEKSHAALNNSIRKDLRNIAIKLRKIAPQIVAPYLKEWRVKFKSFTPKLTTIIKHTAYERLAESPQAFRIVSRGIPAFRD